MTDEEVLAFYAKLEEYYGDSLANFEHHPQQFMHQVKLYLYYRGREINNNQPDKEEA